MNFAPPAGAGYSVYVALDRSGAYVRPILRGVLRYAADAAHWDAHFPMFDARMRRSVQPHRYDGVIRSHGSGGLDRLANGADAASVCISDRPEQDLGHAVIPDNHAVGAMAAAYLLELGFRRFAAVMPLGVGVGRHRFDGFRRRIEQAGYKVQSSAENESTNTAFYIAPLDWLKALPTPCGVFCWNDETARNVVLDARDAGLSVPEDLAVIGVHNDDLICESIRPAITSIALPLEKIGYEAASLLDRLMQGEPGPDKPIRFPPIEVVQRDSTRPTAEDRDVARAIQIIRRRACEGLTVEEVCDDLDLAVSRRTLERRFVEALGRSPHEEIRRVQCQHARHLLVNTNLPQEEVALRCGFSSNPFFSNTFKRVTGERPSEYRKARRRG